MRRVPIKMAWFVSRSTHSTSAPQRWTSCWETLPSVIQCWDGGANTPSRHLLKKWSERIWNSCRRATTTSDFTTVVVLPVVAEFITCMLQGCLLAIDVHAFGGIIN